MLQGVGGHTERMFAVEWILKISEKEIIVATPPEFLAWTVSGSILGNLVCRRRRDF